METMSSSEINGTANDTRGIYQTAENAPKHRSVPDPSVPASYLGQDEIPLSPEEEEKLLDELSLIALGRTDPTLKYDREDIYFDR